MEIVGKNTVEAWKEALINIIKNGHDFKDHDKRLCREVMNMVLTIKDPSLDFEKPVDIVSSIDKWIYPSKEELKGVMMSRRVLPIYVYTYGKRIFNFANELDQVNKYIIPLLDKDPTSRRATLIVYNPLVDSKIYQKEIPSLIYIYFRLIEGKLQLTCCIRSNDFFIGWPTNVYQLSILQDYVATKLGVKPGSIHTISNSAHLFHEYFDEIDKILKNGRRKN